MKFIIFFLIFSISLIDLFCMTHSSNKASVAASTEKIEKAKKEKSRLQKQLSEIQQKKQKPLSQDVLAAQRDLAMERSFGVNIKRTDSHKMAEKYEKKMDKLKQEEKKIKKDIATEEKLEKALNKEEKLLKKRKKLEEVVAKGGAGSILAKGKLKVVKAKEDSVKNKRWKAEQKAEKSRGEAKLQKKYDKHSFSKEEISEISQGNPSLEERSRRVKARVQWKKDLLEQKRLEKASDDNLQLLQSEGSVYAKNLNDRAVRAANKKLSPEEKELFGEFSKDEKAVLKKLADNIDQGKDPIKDFSYEEAKKWEELSAVKLSKGIDENFNKLRGQAISISNDMIDAQNKADKSAGSYRSLFKKDDSISSPIRREKIVKEDEK